MSVREGTRETLGTGAVAVKVPSQFMESGYNRPANIAFWTEDGSEFQYSSTETGTFLTVPAGQSVSIIGAVPDDDGTMIWAKVATGTPVLAMQTSENINRR